MQFRFGRNPAHWVAKDGRPAKCCGLSGLPSFEANGRTLVLFENMVVSRLSAGAVMFFPLRYAAIADLDRAGLVSPNITHESSLDWRPCLYEMVPGGIEGRSSQQELAWRYSVGETIETVASMSKLSKLKEMIKAVAKEAKAEEGVVNATVLDTMTKAVGMKVEADMMQAEARALALLRECLSPQQRIELSAKGRFRVRGGATRKMYRIVLSNGFCEVDPFTDEIITSFCLHPEYWMPAGDVALATKLLLENKDFEGECLANAGRSEEKAKRRKRRVKHVVAANYEAELIV